MTYRIVPTTGKAIIEVDGTEVLELGADQSVKIRGEFNPTKLLVNGKRVASQGRRNVVVNGNCEVVQDVASVAALSDGVVRYGGPDMFKTQISSSAGGQFTQSQGSLTFNGVEKKTVKQTVDTPIADPSGVNFWYGIHQRVEAQHAKHFNGRKLGASFIFNSNVSGIYSFNLVTVDDAVQVKSYTTEFSYTSGSPKKIELSIDTVPLNAIANNNLDRLRITVGFINTGSFNASNNNQWLSTTFLNSPNQVNWATTAGNFIELTELQIEADQVTEFEYESFGENLARCQRYFETSYSYGLAPGSVSTAGRFINGLTSTANGAVYATFEFSQEKRAIPTVIAYTQEGVVNVWLFQRSGVPQTQVSVVTSDQSTGSASVVSSNVGAAYVPVLFYGHWVADARL